jgi:hypothetical protein
MTASLFLFVFLVIAALTFIILVFWSKRFLKIDELLMEYKANRKLLSIIAEKLGVEKDKVDAVNTAVDQGYLKK